MSANTSGKKKRNVISLELKREIIEKQDLGISVVDLAMYNFHYIYHYKVEGSYKSSS